MKDIVVRFFQVKFLNYWLPKRSLLLLVVESDPAGASFFHVGFEEGAHRSEDA